MNMNMKMNMRMKIKMKRKMKLNTKTIMKVSSWVLKKCILNMWVIILTSDFLYLKYM